MIRSLAASCGLLLLLGASAWAQTVQPLQTTSASGGTTCTFGQDVASGSLMILFANSEGSLTLPTSLRGETWVLAESNTANSVFAYAWIGTTTSSGPETITLTGSLIFQACVAAEFPGSYGWTLDVHTNGIPPGNSFTTANITTTQDGDLILGYACGDIYQSSPYLDGHVAFDDGGAGYYIAAINGAHNMAFNAFGGSTIGSYVLLAMKPIALAIVTTSLPTGAIGASYAYTLQAVGGVGSYTWSLASGSLPSGMALNGSTGVLSGTPVGVSASPVFQVTDGSSTTTAALPLTIDASANAISFINAACGTSGITIDTTAGALLLVENDTKGPFSPPTDTVLTNFRYLGVFASPHGPDLHKLAVYGGIAPSSHMGDVIAIGGNSCAVQFANAQLFWDTFTFTSGQSASSATISGPAITSAAPNSFIWAGSDVQSSGTTLAAVAPFVIDANATPGFTVAGEHNLESTVGTYTPAFTQTGNTDGNWNIGALALRPTTGGVVGSMVMRHKTPIF